MGEETAQLNQLISAPVEVKSIAGEDDVRAIYEFARALPFQAVECLLSAKVCNQCILRLFGISEHLYYVSTLSPWLLSSVFGDFTDSEKQKCTKSKDSKVDSVLCSVCLGILQIIYCYDKELVVNKKSANDLAITIADLIKQEGYQIDGFSLEVSIPPVIQENESSVWLCLKKKFGSELWFQGKSQSECISVKDALKISIIKPLESMLGCKSSISTFHVRLTYSHPVASTAIQNSINKNQGFKRRKTGSGNGLKTVDDDLICSDFSMSDVDVVVERPLESLQANESSESFKFPSKLISKPCQLVFSCYRTHIYFGGRYLKYSRNVSQTRWIVDDERMGEASVEELIGSNILPICHGDSYKFHAAGREDIDVRMLGSGRPFLVEIQNARLMPSEDSVKNIEKHINKMEKKLVGVKNLKMVGSEGWTLMREGESEKQKQYAALVWISRPLKDEDFQCISSLKDMHIMQKTPVRVLHRRSPLAREKIIHWMRLERICGHSQYFLLHLCTQAGTYIKEFVHGDLGRTYPSIGSILDCRAEILQLDVTDVKMDCFLTEEGYPLLQC
ncbi:uncharacterized protein LOC107422452 isoform X1 [Ziziphus jujuba]|uniref:tRNA pseudouridine(55) synthase n=1 Tax=Ziziphus jujuba TaxID=326968 RepID=A0A6P4AFZ3_ZIZJJ|nr:uncharacterized protein LOC107422452 isoform X1 [Ziziphus jujuba]